MSDRRTRPARSRLRAVALAAALGVAAAGCAVDDVALGASAAAQIEQDIAIVEDAEAQAALQAFGTALVRASGDTSYVWSFKLVRDSTINAFALPGGFVYVHTALVARADDPSELGGVLGHEIAHAILRHGASQQQTQQVGAVVITAVCLFTGWCDGGLSQLALEAGQAAVFSKFSRTDELEADSAGVEYAADAGLDPRGVVRFFAKLEEEGQRVPALLQVFSTHPMGQERIARVERLLGPAKAERPVPAELTRAFGVLKRAVGAPARAPVGGDGMF